MSDGAREKGGAMERDEHIRVMLLAERQRTGERISTLEAQVSALTQARQGESDDDEHDPEGVTLSAQWSMLSGLLESARANGAQVTEALDRLEAGAYGVCAECGHPIPAAQLEVRPFRERCVACESRREAAARR